MIDGDTGTRKVQGENDDGDFLRDNNEQRGKKDEATQRTQTQETTAIAKKREDYIAHRLTEDEQQEYAHHEPDTIEILIGNDGWGNNKRQNTEPDTKKPNITGHDEYKQAEDKTQERNGRNRNCTHHR